MRTRHGVLGLSLLALSWIASPGTAAASDGFEAAIPMSAALLSTVGLDTTFIVLTATGVIYRDDGWAGAQLTWAGASLIGVGVGMGWAFEQDIPGLAGGLALQGIGSIVLGIYAIVGLSETPTEPSKPSVTFALLPRAGGAELALIGTLE